MIKEFTKGLWKENPVLVLLLGMCPTLGVTSSATNGLGMGVATMFVLLGSNVVVSLIRNVVPKKIRIPVYIVIIATFVTMIDLSMQAYAPKELYDALGLFIPLIVVNCVVLGRAEAFASKNGVAKSVMDGLGMGLGFTMALVALGGVREFLAGGSLFQIKLIPGWTTDFMLWTSAPGAFIILGLFLAGMNALNIRKAKKEGKGYKPASMDCSTCNICDMEDGK
ncbi:electron transport complex subunit E [Pontiella agarivorans]|uniref:Ion-translocating oxidoreductase complex subunit E n=1 Tax=Pontiella agarivorans TaxID=3038953 RepID=A0ABU5N123_9BACT|nr:electron transport complex subunit E [Pontiella agarivorans]MDZ8120128.1 electron transport complex subunit E [Pontiella agarivorans]